MSASFAVNKHERSRPALGRICAFDASVGGDFDQWYCTAGIGNNAACGESFLLEFGCGGPSSHKSALVRDHNFAMRGGMCHNSGEQHFVGVRKPDARGVWMRCSRCGRGAELRNVELAGSFYCGGNLNLTHVNASDGIVDGGCTLRWQGGRMDGNLLIGCRLSDQHRECSTCRCSHCRG